MSLRIKRGENYGYAFIEYASHDQAVKAVQSMNGERVFSEYRLRVEFTKG